MPNKFNVGLSLVVLLILRAADAGVSILHGSSSGRVDGSGTVTGSGAQGWSISGVQVRQEAPAWATDMGYGWWYLGTASATLSDFSDAGLTLTTGFAENYRVELSYQFTVSETVDANIRAWHVGLPFHGPATGYWNYVLKPVDEPYVDSYTISDHFASNGYIFVGRDLTLFAGKTYELRVVVERDGWDDPMFGRPDFRFALNIATGVPAPGGIAAALAVGSLRCRRRRS